MLILLSPAKSLDYETPPTTDRHTLPQFVGESAALIEVLKPYTPAQIASLMDLSEALSQLNVARYGAWSRKFTAANSKQAVLAFNGDVYEGLQAGTLLSPFACRPVSAAGPPPGTRHAAQRAQRV